MYKGQFAKHLRLVFIHFHSHNLPTDLPGLVPTQHRPTIPRPRLGMLVASHCIASRRKKHVDEGNEAEELHRMLGFVSQTKDRV